MVWDISPVGASHCVASVKPAEIRMQKLLTHQMDEALARCVAFFWTRVTWRIIPVGKWLAVSLHFYL